uniref:AraC family transcriptional regulator n=1 Tax=Hydrogenophaga sp. TaxID=1904254 RepID=UPI003566EA60
AHLSPYHWHRVYHALHGETIAVTVRRLRLHRATGYLANSQLPVEQVARRCGYPNAQSFARAFRTAYGMSPLQYRQHGGHTVFRNTPSAQALAPGGYPVELREVPRLRLAGLDHKGSYMAIGKAFEGSFVQLAALDLVGPDSRWIAEYLDDPFAVPEKQLCSRAGLSVPADAVLAAPLVAFDVGGGPCAVLRHRGPYATMRAAYQWLYGHWLVNSGLEAGDAPVFEEYLNNPRDTAPADLLTDIFLPLARTPTP